MIKFLITILRSVLFYLVAAVLTLIWCPILYLLWPLPFAIRRDFFRLWSQLITGSSRWICGVRYRFHGLEQLTDLPVIFFSKHQSAWETVVFPGKLPKNCFVCKASLLNIPFFGWGMRLGRHIPIDRKQTVKAFKAVIRKGQKRLGQDQLSIVIFPEGTRVKPREHPQFHKSGAALAKATGYPVVPIALNSGQCWPNRSWLQFPGTIDVVIGAPFETKGHSIEEINHYSYNWIKQTMQKLEEGKPV